MHCHFIFFIYFSFYFQVQSLLSLSLCPSLHSCTVVVLGKRCIWWPVCFAEYREKNSEKTKRLHRVEDKFEPPTKRQRYRESDKKTTLHVSHKTSSDSSYKIRTQERMKQTTPISVEADIRKVRIKNTQSGSKSNTDKDETGNFDLRGLIKSKPTESGRTLIDYNDIEMF